MLLRTIVAVALAALVEIIPASAFAQVAQATPVTTGNGLSNTGLIALFIVLAVVIVGAFAIVISRRRSTY